MKVYEGGCHCGNLRVAFRTALDPAQMAPRACQCAFCRKHATGAVSDPDGHLEFILKNPDQVHLYRFGLGITEFVICRNCGVYAGAHMPVGEGSIGNVMAHVLDAHAQLHSLLFRWFAAERTKTVGVSGVGNPGHHRHS